MSITEQQTWQTWIIKAGSSLITNHGQGLDQTFIHNWAEQVVALRERKINCVLVSSGAIAEGLTRLNINKRPSTIHGKPLKRNPILNLTCISCWHSLTSFNVSFVSFISFLKRP